MGDDTLTADPTPGSGVAASTKCTPIEPVLVESGARDGAVSVTMSVFGSGAGGEGGSAAFQKKER